jgi:hypothetical protein
MIHAIPIHAKTMVKYKKEDNRIKNILISRALKKANVL